MGFFSAILLGLLASIHCAGMCGGVQGALNHTQVIRSAGDIQRHLLALNFGRITLYALVGMVVALLGSQTVMRLPVAELTLYLRYFMALLLVLIGLQLLFKQFRPFSILEAATYKVWNRLFGTFSLKPAVTLGQSFRYGLLWGFLPCGLVYSVLLASAVGDSVMGGGLTMLGFGLGTVPALILTGNAFVGLITCLKNSFLQTIGGVSFLLFGLMTALAPMLITHNFIKSNPLFYNLVRCF